MSTFLQILVGAVSGGAIYAIVALGWGIVFNVSGLLNFAQGEFVMLGALTMISLTGAGLPFPVALLGSVAAVGLIGLLLERCTLRPARRLTEVTAIIITLGASLVFREAAKLVWGKDPLPLAPLLGDAPLRLGDVGIQSQSLVVVVGTVVILAALWLFFDRTYYGKAMLACAQDPLGATMVGISPATMRTVSFVLSAACGAVAGILIAPLVPMSWDRGTLIGIKGIIAALLGGLGNFRGAVAGGLTVGLMEALAAGYLSSAYKDIVVFGLLVGILLLRPGGLLGASAAIRRP